MRIYADHPDRRAGQLIADVTAVVLGVASVAVGQALRDSIRSIADPAADLEDTSRSLADGLGEAADSVSGIPLVGDSLGDSLQRAADAAGGLEDAGASTVEIVERTGAIIGVLVPAVVVLLAVVVWLRPRISWVREADDARAVRNLPDGTDLLAARALARVRLARLTDYGPDLAGRWKQGDPRASDALARAELDRLGLY